MTADCLRFESMTSSQAMAATQWNDTCRLEERTCRPVAHGVRLPPTDRKLNLVFFEKGITEAVGRVQCFDFNSRNRSAEFGYCVNPLFRGRGVGRRMLIMAITDIFEREGLNKLYCQTAEFNVASVRLLESLGMHRDGILREHHELDGKLWNDFVYSILQPEWQKAIIPGPTDAKGE